MDGELKFRRTFAARVGNRMYELNMTQVDLAKKSGLSEPMISRYLSGSTAVNMYNVRKIANALNCSVDDLIGEQV